jgi:hypothetical protein
MAAASLPRYDSNRDGDSQGPRGTLHAHDSLADEVIKYIHNQKSVTPDLKHIDEIGGPNAYNHFAAGWAWAVPGRAPPAAHEDRDSSRERAEWSQKGTYVALDINSTMF